eukprot:GFUD01024220.1.p1 GENE.GFUD01024220.1~~GFUD01024220.1.p1  ORF type:complete len:435 (+),score=97.46 GFUD01024220.1:38-1342(+)
MAANESKGFDDTAVQEAQQIFSSHGPQALMVHCEGRLNAWETTEMNIAVTGQSGAGKSSFINKLREIEEETNELFAPVGVKQTTMERKEYAFPGNNFIKIWDLPGAGTTDFCIGSYSSKMEFSMYDAFVLLSSGSFLEVDKTISKEVKDLEKPLFFAKTKMDEVLRSAKRVKKRNFNSLETQGEIRSDCQAQLGGGQDTRIFLIASIPEDELDELRIELELDNQNEDLKQAIIDSLPEIQRTALVLTLPCGTDAMLDRKLKEIKKRSKWVSLTSAAVAAIPTVGLSAATDGTLIMAEIYFQKKTLGINEEGLKCRAEACGRGMTIAQFKDALNQELGRVEFTELEQTLIETIFKLAGDGATKLATYIAAAIAASEMAEDAAKLFIPIVGLAVSGTVSGATTYGMLRKIICGHEKIARACIKVTSAALKRSQVRH